MHFRFRRELRQMIRFVWGILGVAGVQSFGPPPDTGSEDPPIGTSLRYLFLLGKSFVP